MQLKAIRTIKTAVNGTDPKQTPMSKVYNEMVKNAIIEYESED